MTNEQQEVMRHALGLDQGKRAYRNHFVTGPGTTDYPHCEELVKAGLMSRREGNELSGGSPVYMVTEAGRAALKEPITMESRYKAALLEIAAHLNKHRVCGGNDVELGSHLTRPIQSIIDRVIPSNEVAEALLYKLNESRGA